MFKIYTLLIMLLSLGGCTDGIRIKQNPTSSVPGPISFSSQSINEGDPIIFNINDGIEDDTFLSSGTITYNCYYDTTIDNDVTTSSSCSSLSGVTFDTDTGVFTWSPGYLLAGSYEFKVMASNGTLQTEGIFAVTINNVDAPPVIAPISNLTADEGQPISISANDINSGCNTDADGDTITYSCYYDTTVDGAVASVSACTTLTGVSFNSATGAMDWTPDGTQAGSYEFKIIASEGDLSVDQIFAATISDVDAAPVISSISDQSVNENSAIAQINANDTGGGDTDVDGDTITYSCYYDTTVDAAVASVTACTSLTGVSFNSSTGVMDWTPDGTQIGNYEFKIIGSEGNLNDDEIFGIEVITAPEPFVSIWRTTGAGESITLPLRNGYDYNFQVDWGDGSPVSTVTSHTDSDRIHPYVVAGTYTITITGMAESWYFNNAGSKLNIIEVVNLGDLGWKSLEGAFYGCSNLTSVAGGDTSQVTSMTSMFRGMTSLTSLDLSSFNTASVTSMGSLFRDASMITALDLSNFNTASVWNMAGMFQGATSLTSVNLSSFNTAAVGNMSDMFFGASSLTTLDLSSFNTAAVWDMSNMFRGASSLTTLNLSNFTTSAVTDMSYMLYGTTSLTSIDVSSFNTAAVTDMSYMFRNASSLTTLNLSSFNTAAVSDMGNMFYGATSLTTLDLSNFNTSSVLDMRSMFSNASSLTTLDLSHFNTAAVTNMSYMFNGTSNLTSLNADTWNISAVTSSGNIWTATNPALIVECDQGGSPGTGHLFTKPCN